MQIVIPMAGRGKRFEDAGYTNPKPLIDVNGIPMIELVVKNLNIPGKHIFICRREHYEQYSLKNLLERTSPNCSIILTDKVTEGAASTVLLAKELINNEDELIIANSDQWVEWNSGQFLNHMRQNQADGGILTFTATGAKWSYIKLDEFGMITEVAEKKPISDIATVGIYYFKKGKYFTDAAEGMIRKNIRVNDEFYVAPVYNEMILSKKKIINYQIKKMMGIGTPEDLNTYLESRNQK